MMTLATQLQTEKVSFLVGPTKCYFKINQVDTDHFNFYTAQNRSTMFCKQHLINFGFFEMFRNSLWLIQRKQYFKIQSIFC